MSKTLVTYFSASGVTARKAQQTANKCGGDVAEIAPEVPYTSADLNWQDKGSRSSVECKDPACRPAMKPVDADFSAYDTVYVGYPIWWYTAPNIIFTFFDAYKDALAGKKVVLFMTSGGTGIAKSVKDLQAAYPSLNISAE